MIECRIAVLFEFRTAVSHWSFTQTNVVTESELVLQTRAECVGVRAGCACAHNVTAGKVEEDAEMVRHGDAEKRFAR